MSVCVCVCVCACVCVCVYVCVSVIISLCGWGYFLCTLIRYMGFMGILFMLSWLFQHDYLDTYCFECLICMCFVFAPVQCN